MEIRLTDREIARAEAETYFGPEFKKENAGVAQNKELRTFIGYCGEIAVQKAFGGKPLDESKAHIGDWVSDSLKTYEIKTQNKYQRKYPILSFDLTTDQWDNVFVNNKADGGILCSVECNSIKDFRNNPVVTIEFYINAWDIRFSFPRGSNPSHTIARSVYADEYDKTLTDWENL